MTLVVVEMTEDNFQFGIWNQNQNFEPVLYFEMNHDHDVDDDEMEEEKKGISRILIVLEEKKYN